MLAAKWIEDARKAGQHGANLLREMVQWDVLVGMSRREAFRKSAFIGGTALRVLYGLPRFSEDLDFSATESGITLSDLHKWMSGAAERLNASGLDSVEVKLGKADKTVLKATLSIPGILKAAGISPMASQKLNIKVEVDTKPPDGWVGKTEVRSRPRLIAIQTYDMPSLMAGKLHALLARPWTKGRDWYDLMWYLGRDVEPNIDLLQTSLDQMPSPLTDDATEWRSCIAGKAKVTDWQKVQHDIASFLEDPSELQLMDANTMLAVLGADEMVGTDIQRI